MILNNNLGLSADDLYKLIHEPEKFELNSANMSQAYLLTQNLIQIFKLNLT